MFHLIKKVHNLGEINNVDYVKFSSGSYCFMKFPADVQAYEDGEVQYSAIQGKW